MATFVGVISDRQIILRAWVRIAGASGLSHISYPALLDTGAQGTMISRKVVQEVGLQQIGHTSIIPVSGESLITEKYRIRLDIPIESRILESDGSVVNEAILRGMDMDVALLPYDPSNYDVLLGMDLLHGFHLTMHGDTYILSN